MRSRRSALPRRAAGTFVAFVTVGALIGGMALPAGAAINTGATAADLAAAIDAQNPTVVTGANLDRPPIGTPDAVSTTPLASFPTDGTGYDVLTTGDANLAGTGNTSGSSGVNDNGATPSGRGNTAFDVSTLRVDVNVPGGLNCLRVDFRFLSEEFPEYVGSQYNDAFIAELDTSDWAASGPTITAPHNFAFDPSHNPISIDSTGFAHMTAGEAAGTTYDGATPLLVAQTPITSGPHSLYFSIFDQGDHVFDSAAFLDNMTLGTQSVTGCQKGAQPLSNVSLTVNGASSATVPAGFSDMPTSGFNYATLAGPGTDGSGVLATAPVNHGPVNHGPVNHGPVNHGPVNHGPVNHGSILDADPAFRYAPLSKLPLSDAAPILLSSVPYAGGDWSSVLPAGLQALPFQTLTLQQAATAIPPATPPTVPVSDVDLRNTVLGGLSAGSLLLSNTSLSQLGLSVPAGFSGGDTLAKIELSGQSISSLPVANIQLKPVSLSNSLLGGMELYAIDFSQTSAWNVPLGSLSNQAAICGGVCPSMSLEAARQAGALNPTATFADLQAGLPAGFTGTFGQLLPGIVSVDNFPFQSVPMGDVLSSATPDPGSEVTYSASASIACPVGGATIAVTIPAAHGFRYVQGTSQFTFGAGEFASTVGPNPQTEPSTSGNVLTWTVPNDPSCSSPDPVSLSFRAEAGPDLGTFSSSASVTNGANTSTILDQAPVTTTENFESNNAPGNATNVTPDHLYTDTISSGQDMDYFSVPVTSGDVGKMVRISLSHVPSGADFDMVLYGAASDSTLRGAPVNHGPVNHGPVNHGPLGDDAECLPPGTVLDPQTLQDVPQLNTGTYSIRSYSTNRGTGSEFACAIVQPGDVGHGLLVQVSSYLDTSSAQAALLQVSESAPVTPLPCLGVPSTDGNPGPSLPAPSSIPSDRQTLFLVNEQAVGKWYGTSAEANVNAALTDPSFLNMPNVKGVVLSVDQDPATAQAYNAWYGDYCSPDKANDVVHAINNLVDTYRQAMPNLKNIALVGSDAVLPSGRIQELVTLGSEATEAANQQYNGNDNPISRAMSFGYMLSDDAYYSFQPMPWLATDLYPPSVAGGRLVETPADIVNEITQYKSSNGILNPSTEFTTGYDFFGDVAQQQDTALHGLGYVSPKSGPNTYASQVNEAWSSANLANGINAKPGIAALNAHANNYLLEPAAAFHAASPSPSDLYSTGDLASSTLGPGTLAFSIGCHAGLSVPDVWVTGTDPAQLDWAQAFAQKGGQLDANTGFGYGDDKTIAYSEKLVLQLAKNLDGSMSVGQAVAFAKQQYYSTLGAWGVFDAKSVEEFTPYGLPMYVVGASGQVAGSVPPVNPPALNTDPDTNLKTATESFSSMNSGAVDTGHGVYYKGPSGQTQAEQYRPIEPITAPQDMTQPSAIGLRLHGALVLSFSKNDISPFTAAISTPDLAPSSDQPVPHTTDATFPSSIVGTFSQDTVFGRRDSLVAFGGQFLSDPSNPNFNTGTQRLFSNMQVRAYYSTSDVYSAALFDNVNAVDQGSSALINMKTSSDGVVAAYVTFRMAGSNAFTSQPMTFDTNDNTWKATINTPQPGPKVAEYFVQMVTSTGDVSTSDDKALSYPKPALPPPGPSTVQVNVTDGNGNPVSPSENGWYSRSPLNVSVTSHAQQFTLAEMVGNSTVPLSNPATISANGPHTLVYTSTDAPVATDHFQVNVDASAPTLSACPTPSTYYLNSNGGSVHLSVSPTAGGPSGINQAASTLQATLDTSSVGTKTLTFSAFDYAGNSVSEACTYSVQYKFSGFFQPVNNPTSSAPVNSAKAGQAVPVKWQITDANGVAISDPKSFVSVTVRGTNTACAGTIDPIESYTGSSGVQYLGGGNWQANWATPKAYAGSCKTMVLTLNDGVNPASGDPRTAYFQFK